MSNILGNKEKGGTMTKAAGIANRVLLKVSGCSSGHKIKRKAVAIADKVISKTTEKKAEQLYDAYGNPVEQSSVMKPISIGAGIGGLGAHLFPNQLAASLREQAKVTKPGNSYLRSTLKRKAFGANLGRLSKALLMGAAAGGLAHEITN